jgi:hypothetical protein
MTGFSHIADITSPLQSIVNRRCLRLEVFTRQIQITDLMSSERDV